MTMTGTARHEFWRRVDAKLIAAGSEAATNGEIELVIKTWPKTIDHLRTICTGPEFAAEFITGLREPCFCCETPTRLRDGKIPTCLNCFGRSNP